MLFTLNVGRFACLAIVEVGLLCRTSSKHPLPPSMPPNPGDSQGGHAKSDLTNHWMPYGRDAVPYAVYHSKERNAPKSHWQQQWSSPPASLPPSSKGRQFPTYREESYCLLVVAACPPPQIGLSTHSIPALPPPTHNTQRGMHGLVGDDH